MRMSTAEQELLKTREERDALRAKVAALQSLRDVARALSLELDLRHLLYMIMDSAAELVQAAACTLLLHDKDRHELVFDVVTGGGGTELQQRRMPDDSGVPGWVVANQLPLIVNDAANDPRVRRDISDSVDYVVRSILAVPLMAHGRLIGVLEVLNKRSGADFTGDDLDLLGAFAAQAAVAIDNARLVSDLREERDRLVDAEETLRRKLQEELHDGLAQALSSAAMKADVISRGLLKDPSKGAVELSVLQDDLRETVRMVRAVLFELRPLVLETQGLVAALEALASRTRPESTCKVHLDLAGYAERLERRVEVSIYGVVQEALNNIFKHAQAQNVWITLASQPEPAPDLARLTIRDDGRGFDMNAVNERYEQRGSFGLLNMQERASHVGGDLQITSSPGSGTTVVLALKREAEAKPAPA